MREMNECEMTMIVGGTDAATGLPENDIELAAGSSGTEVLSWGIRPRFTHRWASGGVIA